MSKSRPADGYTDHLVGRPVPWPLHDDGRPLTITEAHALMIQICEFFAHAGAFSLQRLRHWLPSPRPEHSPPRTTRPLYAVPGCAAAACVDVPEAALVRVRCGEVVCVAARLAAAVAQFVSPADERFHFGEMIVAWVASSRIKIVEVRQQMALHIVQ